MLAEQQRIRLEFAPVFAAAAVITARVADEVAAQFLAFGQAMAIVGSADPDEPTWCDAMRYDPDTSEEWTP